MVVGGCLRHWTFLAWTFRLSTAEHAMLNFRMLSRLLQRSIQVAEVFHLIDEHKSYHRKRSRCTREIFNKIDRDQTGRISRPEFVRYMLVRQGKVCACCFWMHFTAVSNTFLRSIVSRTEKGCERQVEQNYVDKNCLIHSQLESYIVNHACRNSLLHSARWT